MSDAANAHLGPRLAVLAIGNLVRKDEGVGVHALRAIIDRLPEGISAHDGGTLGLNLLPALRDVDWLLVLDAVDVGREPGTFVVLQATDIPASTPQKLSVHEAGFLDVLAMLDLLGERPKRLVIHGIQPQTIEWGDDLSPPVAAALPRMIDASLSLLRAWAVERTALASPG